MNLIAAFAWSANSFLAASKLARHHKNLHLIEDRGPRKTVDQTTIALMVAARPATPIATDFNTEHKHPPSRGCFTN
jgi:hypothetical protein